MYDRLKMVERRERRLAWQLVAMVLAFIAATGLFCGVGL
jgi:hypothetical protein